MFPEENVEKNRKIYSLCFCIVVNPRDFQFLLYNFLDFFFFGLTVNITLNLTKKQSYLHYAKTKWNSCNKREYRGSDLLGRRFKPKGGIWL